MQTCSGTQRVPLLATTCQMAVELGINDICCRLAFKYAVRWYNINPDPLQSATWRVDMVVVAYNQICCTERLSRQSLASFTLNDFGRAHWILHEDCG